MPARFAAEVGLLGHDAVVVGEGEDDAAVHQLLERACDFLTGKELGEDGMSALGVLEASNGPSADGVEALGGTGVVEIGFELERADFVRESPLSGGEHGLLVVGGDLLAKDEISVLVEKRNPVRGEGPGG